MGLTHNDGISVYGSGLYYGKKGSETYLLGTGFRADSGTTGFSGAQLSISTKLSTITAGIACLKKSADTMKSGMATTVGIDWSGGAIDLLIAYNNTSASTSSAAASSIVSWIVFGK